MDRLPYMFLTNPNRNPNLNPNPNLNLNLSYLISLVKHLILIGLQAAKRNFFHWMMEQIKDILVDPLLWMEITLLLVVWVDLMEYMRVDLLSFMNIMEPHGLRCKKLYHLIWDQVDFSVVLARLVEPQLLLEKITQIHIQKTILVLLTFIIETKMEHGVPK